MACGRREIKIGCRMTLYKSAPFHFFFSVLLLNGFSCMHKHLKGEKRGGRSLYPGNYHFMHERERKRREKERESERKKEKEKQREREREKERERGL